MPSLERLRPCCAGAMAAVAMLSGCAMGPALVDLYAGQRWADLPSVNALVLASDELGVSIEAIGYVQGPPGVRSGPTVVWDLPGFVVPMRMEAAGMVGADGAARACAQHTVDVLAVALRRVAQRFADRYRGVTLPAVDLEVAAPGQGLRLWNSSQGAGFASTVIRLALPAFPQADRCAFDAPFWAADTVATVVHELQHVVAFQRPTGRPDLLADEFVASLVETCARHVVLGRLPGELIVGFRFGPDAVAAVRQRWREGRLQTSMAGKFLAEAVRRTALGTDDIVGDRGESLLQLCDAAELAYALPQADAEVAGWRRRVP